MGLSWIDDSPKRKHDSYKRRSVPLSDLTPLTNVPNVRFVNLHNGAGQEITNAFRHTEVLDFTGDPNFGDGVALLSCLDAVVTAGNSTSHLAGTLGQRGIVILPYFADWRWRTEKEQSRMYPCLSLSRQHRPGEWTEAVNNAVLLLTNMAAEQHAHATTDGLAISHRQHLLIHGF